MRIFDEHDQRAHAEGTRQAAERAVRAAAHLRQQKSVSR